MLDRGNVAEFGDIPTLLGVGSGRAPAGTTPLGGHAALTTTIDPPGDSHERGAASVNHSRTPFVVNGSFRDMVAGAGLIPSHLQ